MKKSEIIEVLAYVKQAWPSYRIAEADLPAAIEVWYDLLGDLDVLAVRAVLRQLATEDDDFAPTPGQVRRALIERTQPEGQAPTVDEAWGEVQREIHRVGYQVELNRPERTLAFSHPAITAVVNAMGWDSICRSTNEVADRAHFVRMYAEQVRRAVDRAAVPALPAAVVPAGALPTGEPDDQGPRRVSASLGVMRKP